MTTFNRIIEYLYEFKKNLKTVSFKKHSYWFYRLKRFSSKVVYVVGIPEHSNLGDNAIAIAQILFLNRCGIPNKDIIGLTDREIRDDFKYIKHYINHNSLLCFLGGGNMGNQWWGEENVRRNVLSQFPTNPSIIFPQSIFYQGKNRELEERASIKFYNEKTNLTIVARERMSYDKMVGLYPKTKIMLVPDIVLSSTMRDYGVSCQQRNGVVLCLRNDAERKIDEEVWTRLKAYIDSLGLSYYTTDMYADRPITNENKLYCVSEKMKQFRGARLVITDRLHAMIFCVITETPCIVFSNYNHKIYGSYQWIRSLGYIKYADTPEDAISFIPELLNMHDCRYDSSMIMGEYEKLKSEIMAKWSHR